METARRNLHALDQEKLAWSRRARSGQLHGLEKTWGATVKYPPAWYPMVLADEEVVTVGQSTKQPHLLKGTILRGLCDDGSPLAMLRGHDDVLQLIMDHVHKLWYAALDVETISVMQVGHVEFPAPTGININMLPFIMGDETSIPVHYRHYCPLINACPVPLEEFGRVCYLTIQESEVDGGTSQRRPGIHTESPGVLMRPSSRGAWRVVATEKMHVPSAFRWGRGFYSTSGENGHLQGGLYLASNVDQSTRVWDVKVSNPAEVVGDHGDLEHLRPVLGPGHTLAAGQLVWLTDMTPHESIPLAPGTQRSFFRLVTSRITAWLADHSTPNERGVRPASDVEIVHGNKFAGAAFVSASSRR